MKNFFGKFNTNRPAHLAIAILVILVTLRYITRNNKSAYRNLETTPSEMACDLFKLPNKLECVPGPQATASPYTKDLTPGGICGAQECVRAHAEDYTIVGGIGGSLLDQ